MQKDEKKGLNLLKACALQYKDGMYAPIIKAYGEGKTAEKIVGIAEENDIPIEKGEAEAILNMLKTVKVNEMIPVELYEATARIFAMFLIKGRHVK